MHLTKFRLKQIILEEAQSLLFENYPPFKHEPLTPEQIEQIISYLRNPGTPPECSPERLATRPKGYPDYAEWPPYHIKKRCAKWIKQKPAVSSRRERRGIERGK